MPNSYDHSWTISVSELSVLWDTTVHAPTPVPAVPPEQWDDFRVGDLVTPTGTVNRNKGRTGRIVLIIRRPDLGYVGPRDNMHMHRELVVEWFDDDKSATHPSGTVFCTHSGLNIKHIDDYNL